VGKRVFDLVVAFAGLIVLAPLMAAIACAIKLDSPGPVLFRQERVGRYGRTFRIHKFRTMVADAAERGLPITVGTDARITRVGRWLRARRLDELPQLIDVLQGRMSVVGPRPEVPRYVAFYPKDLRDAVLAVRPGITDPASLAHTDEDERLARAVDPEREYVEVVMPAKLVQAAAYAREANWASDLRIITRSLALLVGRGQRR
jgi:lipopolysaccharide/colanic/teichoic acid biosynthesis glycosyltransferase